MKNEEYKLNQMKYKLRELKERRVKIVIWKLTREEREYIEELGYEVIPYLYEISTKTFKNLYEIKDSRIRDIHYSSKQGKKTIILRLKKKDMEVLKDFNIKFRPVKFKIRLVS